MEKQKDKKIKIIIVLLIAGIILFNLYSFLTKPIEVREVEVRFVIGDSFGINKSDSLDFGILPRGSNAVKMVEFANNKGYGLRIVPLVEAGLRDFIYIEEGYLDFNGEIEIPVNLFIPENADYGNYSGKIRFEIYKI